MPQAITIDDAKKELRKNLAKGTQCPCCNLFVKMYKRPITSAMAWGLIMFYKSNTAKDEFLHAEDFFKIRECPSSIRGDFSKLRFWGLIQAHDVKGYYKITPKGMDFVESKIKVPARVHLYNDKVYGWDEKQVGIDTCLKKKFDYNKLMNDSL